MNNNIKYIGYLKYSVKSVKDGLMDARKSAEALLGFDEIIRYFAIKKCSKLKDKDFEIPVRIRKGSWEALIPAAIGLLIVGPYLKKTAEKAAEDGIFNTGLAKDIKMAVIHSIKAAQWIIRISKHIGTTHKKQFDRIKFKDNSNLIGIPNNNNEYLYVPKEYLDLFIDSPNTLFSNVSSVINNERILEIGMFENNKEIKVDITNNEKNIFYSESDNNEILFPELKHGQFVELEGEITRGNEKTNSIGFEYQGHILTCYPEQNNIASYKNKIISHEENHFFPKVKIIGVIDRKDRDGKFKEKRPHIIFTDIVTLEKENLQLF